jgi:hypothetical protein
MTEAGKKTSMKNLAGPMKHDRVVYYIEISFQLNSYNPTLYHKSINVSHHPLLFLPI